jgi:hypothetical protein
MLFCQPPSRRHSTTGRGLAGGTQEAPGRACILLRDLRLETSRRSRCRKCDFAPRSPPTEVTFPPKSGRGGVRHRRALQAESEGRMLRLYAEPNGSNCWKRSAAACSAAACRGRTCEGPAQIALWGRGRCEAALSCGSAEYDRRRSQAQSQVLDVSRLVDENAFCLLWGVLCRRKRHDNNIMKAGIRRQNQNVIS